MKTRREHALTFLHILCAGWIMTTLVGCEKDKPANAAPPPVQENGEAVPAPGDDGPIRLSEIDGAIVFLKDGRTIVIDETGREASPCALQAAKPHDGTRVSGSGIREEIAKAYDETLVECPKTSNTTINEINSLAVVKHTGSHCYAVSGTSFGSGKASTHAYTFPAGCNPNH